MGMHPLENEHIVIKRDGGELIPCRRDRRIGDRPRPPHPGPRRRRRRCARGVPVVLLDHQPGNARHAAALGVALQLSGHTHGGMIVGIEQLGARANGGYISRPVPGRRDDAHVNNGAALWPGFALRLGRPSELTRITLRRTGTGDAVHASPVATAAIRRFAERLRNDQPQRRDEKVERAESCVRATSSIVGTLAPPARSQRPRPRSSTGLRSGSSPTARERAPAADAGDKLCQTCRERPDAEHCEHRVHARLQRPGHCNCGHETDHNVQRLRRIGAEAAAAARVKPVREHPTRGAHQRIAAAPRMRGADGNRSRDPSRRNNGAHEDSSARVRRSFPFAGRPLSDCLSCHSPDLRRAPGRLRPRLYIAIIFISTYVWMD